MPTSFKPVDILLLVPYYRQLLYLAANLFVLKCKNHIWSAFKEPYVTFPACPTLAMEQPNELLFHLAPAVWADMFTCTHIALLEFGKDFLSRHTAGQQLLQHIFCFAFLCFFCCLCFGGSFFIFGFGKFLGGGFQFCFLDFQLRFQIIEICSQRGNLRFDFFLFSSLFCNDGCIINGSFYGTGLVLASLGSCYDNVLLYGEMI